MKGELLEESKWWIATRMTSLIHGTIFILINIYGPYDQKEKAEVWVNISSFIAKYVDCLVVVGGGFNAIRSLSEKEGGTRGLNTAQRLFNNFISSNNLMDIAFSKGNFTWSNRQEGENRIIQKLDRFHLSENWSSAAVIWEALVWPISGSDHFPISISIQKDFVPQRCPFKFEKMRLRKPDSYEQIVRWWNDPVKLNVSKANMVVCKLRHVKEKLKEWNRSSFGNIFANKQRLRSRWRV